MLWLSASLSCYSYYILIVVDAGRVMIIDAHFHYVFRYAFVLILNV